MKRLVIVMALCVAFCAISAQTRYATARLRGMADALGLTAQIASLPDGDYREGFAYASFPLHLIIDRGTVSHIGWSLPPAGAASAALRFVERHALEQALCKADALPVDWVCSDEAFCSEGKIEDVLRADNENLTFTCKNVQGRQYQASWATSGGKTLCTVVFPVNYELISGATLREMESDLYDCLRSLPPCTEPIVGYRLPSVEEPAAEYTVVKGAPLPGSLLENAVYLKAGKRTKSPQLVFDPQLPVETLANAMSSTIASQDIAAEVKMMMYGVSGRNRRFTMPLSALVGYFLRQGCSPYWGVMESDRDSVTLAVKMANPDLGYVHLLKVTAALDRLFGPEPAVDVTLAAYVNDKTTQEIIYE